MKFIIIFTAIIFLTSCRELRLSDKDLKWMPYAGNETLIFHSTTGEADTIFFLAKETGWGLPDPIFETLKYEEVVVFCKHTDSSPPDGKHRYLENRFMELEKSKDGRARLNIRLSAKEAKFYRVFGPRVDSLEKEKPTTLPTKRKTYRDVCVIDDEDWLNFKERSNYITKLYWSKSEGLVRYDKQDSVYWELASKFSR